MGIPIDKAEILAIFLETFLYGIFFTLYWITVLVLVQRGNSGRAQRRSLLPVATLLIVIATCHLIIDFVRVVQGFVTFVNTIQGGANGYYANIANPLHVGKTALYVTQTLIGDGVIIWRCYVVNQKSLYMLVPALIVLVVNACAGYVVTWSLSQAVPGSSIFHTASSWITTFFVLTMCINVTCTAAIAYRIYWTRRNLRSTNSLLPVAIVIVESGALYATGVLGLLISYLSGSNGQYPALDICTPLVGIAFSLIVLQIRFHLGSTSHVGNSSAGTEGVISTPNWRQRNTQTISGSDSRGYSLQPVAVRITEQTEIDSDHVGIRNTKDIDRYEFSPSPVEKPVHI